MSTPAPAVHNPAAGMGDRRRRLTARQVLRDRGELEPATRLSYWRSLLSIPQEAGGGDAATVGVVGGGDTSASLATPSATPTTTAVNINIEGEMDAGSVRALHDDVASVALDLPNQRVVTVDVQRTRGDIPDLRSEADQLALQQLLTYFCKKGFSWRPPVRRKGAWSATPPLPSLPTPAGHATTTTTVHYRQGLNEVVGVLWTMLRTRPATTRLGETMQLLACLVNHYLPRIYGSNDDTFLSLQCSFRLYRLLLLYHDPQLCKVLDQYDLSPELYATPWFLTLFARGNDIPAVLCLWDHMLACLARLGPIFLHFVAVSFIISFRSAIMSAAADTSLTVELPLIVSKLTFGGKRHVREVVSGALALAAETPTTYQRLLFNVCYSSGTVSPLDGSFTPPLPISPALLSRLEARTCIKISVDEVMTAAGSRLAPQAPHTHRATRRHVGGVQGATGVEGEGAPCTPKSMARDGGGYVDVWGGAHAGEGPAPRFFLIDCRQRVEYEGGHLPTAFHLDPDLLQQPERLEHVMEGLSKLMGVHIAVMGPGDPTVWYHAPVVPPELLVAAATSAHPSTPVTPASTAGAVGGGGEDESTDGSEGEGGVEDMGIAAPAWMSRFAAGGRLDEEDAAVRSGLDPLSASEEDDYGGSGDATRALVLLFLQRGFPHVCEVEGGYTALHQHQAHYLDTVLVGHRPHACVVCGGGAAAVHGRRRASTAASTPSSSSWSDRARTPTPVAIHAPAAVITTVLKPRAPAAAKARVDALAKWLKAPEPSGGVGGPSPPIPPVPAHTGARAVASSTNFAPDDDGEVVIDLFPVPGPVIGKPHVPTTTSPGTATATAFAAAAPSRKALTTSIAAIKSAAAAVLASPPPSSAMDRVASTRHRAGSDLRPDPQPLLPRSRGNSMTATAPPSRPVGVVPPATMAPGTTTMHTPAGPRSSVDVSHGHAPPTSRPSAHVGVRDWVDGYDASGLPILSEEAQLEFQCDNLERNVGLQHPHTLPSMKRAGGGDITFPLPSAKGATAAPPAPAPAPAPAPVNVDEAILASTLAATKTASGALKSWWSGGGGKRGLAPPSSTVGGASSTGDRLAPLPPATIRALPPSGRGGAITARTTQFLATRSTPAPSSGSA